MLSVRLSVSSRFMLVLVVEFTFLVCISAVSLINLKHASIQARTDEVKHLLEAANSIVDFYHGQSFKGLMTDKAERKASKDAYVPEVRHRCCNSAQEESQ